MRIAISAENASGLDSPVCPHFGHSPFFVLVDIQDDGTVANVSSVPNPCLNNHTCGNVVGFIKSQNADVMISGGMGGGAIAFFNQYGIEVATGASGTVRDAVGAYFDSALSGEAQCAGGHGACH